MYYPMRYPHGDWSARDPIHATDVWLHTEDGVRLHGWFLQSDGSPLVTLFLHGNAGNVTHRAPAMERIAQAGSSILVIDYRGFGRSDGAPSERGLYRDARAAWAWLNKSGHRPRNIILHGESLGTAVAVRLATEVPECAGIVLEAPFTSARGAAARVLPILGPLLVSGFDSISRIGRIHAPSLIIHGDQDEIIPYDLGQELFRAAPEPKHLFTVPGAHHNDILDVAGDAYTNRLRDFYKSLPASIR
jgi:uncharacterized protein